jgi:hypothetical protein
LLQLHLNVVISINSQKYDIVILNRPRQNCLSERHLQLSERSPDASDARRNAGHNPRVDQLVFKFAGVDADGDATLGQALVDADKHQICDLFHFWLRELTEDDDLIESDSATQAGSTASFPPAPDCECCCIEWWLHLRHGGVKAHAATTFFNHL